MTLLTVVLLLALIVFTGPVLFTAHSTPNTFSNQYLMAVILAQAKLLELDIQKLPEGSYSGDLGNRFYWNLQLTQYSPSKKKVACLDESQKESTLEHYDLCRGTFKKALMKITWKDLDTQRQAVVVEYFPKNKPINHSPLAFMPCKGSEQTCDGPIVDF